MSVTIAQVGSIADCERCHYVASAVWGPGSACSVAQMVVHARYGGVILLALDGEEPVGFLFSFPARYRQEWVLWSHETAVLPSRVHEGIGYALKRTQQRCAAEMGYPSIAWTFDPLVARNAYFNVHKLGARISEYKRNVYGTDDTDLINRGVETDRFVAVWSTDHVSDRGIDDSTSHHEIHTALGNGLDSQPLVDMNLGSHPVVGTEVPGDFSSLLMDHMDLAKTWRYSFRQVAEALYGKGYHPAEVRRTRDCTKYIWMWDGVRNRES